MTTAPMNMPTAGRAAGGARLLCPVTSPHGGTPHARSLGNPWRERRRPQGPRAEVTLRRRNFRRWQFSRRFFYPHFWSFGFLSFRFRLWFFRFWFARGLDWPTELSGREWVERADVLDELGAYHRFVPAGRSCVIGFDHRQTCQLIRAPHKRHIRRFKREHSETWVPTRPDDADALTNFGPAALTRCAFRGVRTRSDGRVGEPLARARFDDQAAPQAVAAARPGDRTGDAAQAPVRVRFGAGEFATGAGGACRADERQNSKKGEKARGVVAVTEHWRTKTRICANATRMQGTTTGAPLRP